MVEEDCKLLCFHQNVHVTSGGVLLGRDANLELLATTINLHKLWQRGRCHRLCFFLLLLVLEQRSFRIHLFLEAFGDFHLPQVLQLRQAQR